MMLAKLFTPNAVVQNIKSNVEERNNHLQFKQITKIRKYCRFRTPEKIIMQEGY